MSYGLARPRLRGCVWLRARHTRLSADGDLTIVRERGDFMLPRKASLRGLVLPVPQTDTGSQVEYTEESERIVAKELGKMSP